MAPVVAQVQQRQILPMFRARIRHHLRLDRQLADRPSILDQLLGHEQWVKLRHRACRALLRIQQMLDMPVVGNHVSSREDKRLSTAIDANARAFTTFRANGDADRLKT